MGKTLGEPDDPLLVSVRSGAKFSMPGMMETVLDIGLNDESVARAGRAGRRRRAVRLGLLPSADPDVRQDRARHRRRATSTTRCDAGEDGPGRRERPRPRRGRPAGARRRVQEDRRATQTGREFPQDPREQLDLADPGRSSTPGTPTGPRSTAARSASRTTWAPRSTSWRWCSATSARTPAPASRSPATRPPASGRLRRLPARRPGRGRRRRHPQHRAAAELEQLDAVVRRADGDMATLERTTATCATSSSRSSAGGCGCCRPGSASGPRPPRS